MNKPIAVRRVRIASFWICLVFLLSGCANFSGVSAGQIIPPTDPGSPFEGKWIVLQVLGVGLEGDGKADWEDSSVQFSEDMIVFGGQMWDMLSYKIKRVDAAAYMAEKSALELDVLEEYCAMKVSAKVDVITIYTSDNYLGEFMRVDDSHMVFLVQNKDILLKKVSDQPDEMLREIYSKGKAQGGDAPADMSGVLIGLRTPVGADYAYRTVWIASDGEKLRSVLVSQHLFFPRTSGFWECKVLDVDVDGERGNVLTAHSAFAKETQQEQAENPEQELGVQSEGIIQEDTDAIAESDVPSVQIIHYIGNDYVSVEKVSGGLRHLHVLPVDTLSSPTKIKAGDLLGTDGWAAFVSARKEELQALEMERIEEIETDDAGENFGVIRDKGHWKLMGRVNYFQGERPSHMDFELKAIPPHSLIYYDTLAVNWNNIKDRVPDAQDAFTSPDRNLALVKTKNRLGVYAIGAEKLSESLLGEIELHEGEVVVMAEWAMAIYVDSWERAFLAYGARVL